MSSNTRVITTCDICADEGRETEDAVRTSFVVFGERVELDVCGVHGDEIRERVEPYVELTARVNPPMRYNGRTRSSAAALAPPQVKRDLTAVRMWAREQGLQVSMRGRVSSEVLAKYDAAH